jgi:RNA polymerase sigma factor (sigma-70 family)
MARGQPDTVLRHLQCVLLTEDAVHFTDAELVHRFVEGRDESAFTVLVRRHGPLVLTVCRRILGREADAEDAFQATFLVLARNASSVRKTMSLASWLHGVAFRCANDFRKSAMRRRKHEEVAGEERASESPVANAAMNELQAFLDEEIQRLPEKHRAPFILCCLEGKSRTEAAQALGWKEGTLSTRLAKTREILQRRLTARGVTLSAALCAVAISPAATSATVPAALAHATFDAALAFAAGSAAGTVPAAILGVAEGVLKAMFISKLKIGVVLLLAACLTLFAVGLLAQSGAGDDAPKKAAAQNPAPSPKVEEPADASADGELALTGTVVDEAKNPVAGATVTAIDSRKNLPSVKSGVDGAFRLPVGPRVRERVYVLIVAEGANGKLGCATVNEKRPQPVQVVLKVPREVKLNVTDSGNKSVDGADVYVMGDHWIVAKGRTDAQGRWTGRVPADAYDSSHGSGAIALKSKVGFDYVMLKQGPKGNDDPERLPDQIHLKLDGARTLRVKTVDSDGKPIAGVKVGPGYIRKPGREGDVNLSGVSELFQTTGIDGAVFDWLPERFVDHLPMIVDSDNFFIADHSVAIMAEDLAVELSVPLLPMECISGRVTHADGRPAAGITVNAEGQGEGHGGFRGSVRTDAAGRYVFEKAQSDQAYVVTVSDKEWAAPIKSGIVLRKGKPIEGLDFVLCPATRVHGRVTIAPDGTPAVKETVWVGTILGPYPAELRKKDNRRYQSMGRQWAVETDTEGRYEFNLGPGVYDLRGPPPVESASIKIPAANAPKEIVRDFTVIPRPKTAPFAGRVVDDMGQPIAKAQVNGVYASNLASSRGIEPMSTGDDGRFQLERLLVPTVFHVRTADGLRAGMVRIGADASKVDVVIRPVGKATGRLLNLKGNPIAKHTLRLGIRVSLGDSETNPSIMTLFGDFGGRVMTDEQGRFELGGLVAGAGESYSIDFPYDSDRSFITIKTFELKDARELEFGDLRIRLEPRNEYVPPTAAKRATEAFGASKSNTPLKRKDKILVEARREYTRPMLLFGQPKDPACIELFRLFDEREEADDATDNAKRPTPNTMRWQFELASLDTEQPDVRKLAQTLGVELGKGSPILAVLDADGKLTATHALALDAKQMLDSDALGSFLAKHKLATRDAEKMLADAFTKAKAEDKRVFFIASASWCGPCRLLGRFLEPWKSELNRHFVFVKLDISRDEHADSVRKRIQGDQDGGVPWYAILDNDGKTLITSNSPDRKRQGKAANIGFPSEAAEIEHFMNMLAQTAPRLTDQQRSEIRQSLLKKE